MFKVENLIDLIKSKVSSSASYLFMVSELVKKVSKIIKDKRGGIDDLEDDDDYEYEVKPKKRKKRGK